VRLYRLPPNTWQTDVTAHVHRIARSLYNAVPRNGRAQLDAAYNNSAAVPERDAIVAGWAARSARVRREYAGRLDLAYGETSRERLDLVLAADPQAPTLVFIHGGYCQMNDKENFAFFGEGLLPSGSISRSSNTLWRQRPGSTASFLRYAAPCGGSLNISASTAPTRTSSTSPDILPAVT
jgi:hypothetical protein